MDLEIKETVELVSYSKRLCLDGSYFDFDNFLLLDSVIDDTEHFGTFQRLK